MDFKNKYLKYKKKYLELKNLLGGNELKTDDDKFIITDNYENEFAELLIKYKKYSDELTKHLTDTINRAYKGIKEKQIDKEYRMAFIFDKLMIIFDHIYIFYDKDKQYIDIVCNEIKRISEMVRDDQSLNNYFKENLILSAYAHLFLYKKILFIRKHEVEFEDKIKGYSALLKIYYQSKPSYSNYDTNVEYYKKLMTWMDNYKKYVDDLYKQYSEEYTNYKSYIDYKTSKFGFTGTWTKPKSLNDFPDNHLGLITAELSILYNKDMWLSNIWAKLILN